MKAKLLAGIGSGLVMSLLVIAGLTVSVGAAAPANSVVVADRVSICHLQDKVDPTLLFNDGKVISADKNSCVAHCRHGDHPMPVPADNNGHPNRACARVHAVEGLPSCEVNTPGGATCSVDACIARCEAT